MIRNNILEYFLSNFYFSTLKLCIYAHPPESQLADTASVLQTGGKPSTWFPPGELVEQSRLSLEAKGSFFDKFKVFLIIF